MADDARLYPPLRVLNDRLTALEREASRLRSLRAIVVQAQQDREHYGPADPIRPDASRPASEGKDGAL